MKLQKLHFSIFRIQVLVHSFPNKCSFRFRLSSFLWLNQIFLTTSSFSFPTKHIIRPRHKLSLCIYSSMSFSLPHQIISNFYPASCSLICILQWLSLCHTKASQTFLPPHLYSPMAFSLPHQTISNFSPTSCLPKISFFLADFTPTFALFSSRDGIHKSQLDGSP
jgi:hypothetical protein